MVSAEVSAETKVTGRGKLVTHRQAQRQTPLVFKPRMTLLAVVVASKAPSTMMDTAGFVVKVTRFTGALSLAELHFNG